jgi:TRAP-type uncharacterized transport system fused permease subunit
MTAAWKYTLPAFLVPCAFTLGPDGLGLLLRAPLNVNVRATLFAAAGVAALAAGTGGWMRGKATSAERTLLVAAGLLLCYPSVMTSLGGAALAGAVAVTHWARTGRQDSR